MIVGPILAYAWRQRPTRPTDLAHAPWIDHANSMAATLRAGNCRSYASRESVTNSLLRTREASCACVCLVLYYWLGGFHKLFFRHPEPPLPLSVMAIILQQKLSRCKLSRHNESYLLEIFNMAIKVGICDRIRVVGWNALECIKFCKPSTSTSSSKSQSVL